MTKTIELGKGIGEDLLFGMRFEAVKKVLGEPDGIDNSRLDDDEGETVAWLYDNLGLTLYFDEEDEWRLGTIETDDENFTLNGEKLIGRSFAETDRALKNMGIGEIEEEVFAAEETDGVETRLLFSEEKCLNVWFENGVCTEIQWSPFWRNGEQVWAV